MDDLETLRKKATSLIDQARDVGEIEKGATLLRLAAEVEKQRAETRKIGIEEQKLQAEAQASRGSYIARIAPWVSTLVLAGGLVLQGYQARSAEKEQAVQREDARWAALQKTVSESASEGKGTIQEAVEIGEFLRSTRYHDIALATANDFLRLNDGIDEKGEQAFKTLFSAVYGHLDWKDLDRALDLDRDLTKAWNEKSAKKADDPRLHLIVDELSFIGGRVAELLRKHRPADMPLDLHSVSFFDDDLSSTDLHGANLEGFIPGRVLLDHADLSGVQEPRTGYWKDSLWWHAEHISPGLLKYLCANAPYTDAPTGHYGMTARPEDEQQQQKQVCSKP